MLIEAAENSLSSNELTADLYKRTMSDLNNHRRWLKSALDFLAKLQTERHQSDPTHAPSRLARVFALKAKPIATPATPATPADPQTPRNALCPCGSGQKFKRCCGKDAPPQLHYNAA